MKNRLMAVAALVLFMTSCEKQVEREYPTSSFDVTVKEERCSCNLEWRLGENGQLHTDAQSDTSQTLFVTKWNKVTVTAEGGPSFEGCNCSCGSEAVNVERLSDSSFSISYVEDSTTPLIVEMTAGGYSRSFTVRSKEVIPLDYILVDVDGKVWKVPGQQYKGTRYFKPYIENPDFSGTSRYGDALGTFIIKGKSSVWVRNYYEATAKLVGFSPENTSMRNVDFASTTAKFYESAQNYGTDKGEKLDKDISEVMQMTFNSKCVDWSWGPFFLCLHCTVSAVNDEGNKTTREFVCGLLGGGDAN